jgi:uncharacterized protein DUF2865
MTKRSGTPWTFVVMVLLGIGVFAPAAQAQDFFSNLFGGFGRSRAPAIRMPFGSEGENFGQAAPRQRYGGGEAHCVRTCDGRHFPVTGNDSQSRAEICKSFCPASETKVVYGGSIDTSATEDGKSYSALPNAFRYRNEIVAGCTCNGKDPLGLASVSIDKDPTLRKGDIVAGDNGLVVAGRGADKRGAELNFSPASEKIRARYQRMPVVARE